MKILYYFFKYALIMTIGYLIKYIGIPNIFSLPFIVLILYNYLAILYGIKRPLENRRDIKYKDILIPMIILTNIFDTVLIYISDVTIGGWIILIISNTLELIIAKPKYEKINEENKKYIDEYFLNK